MGNRIFFLLAVFASALALSACSAKIYGKVQLVDQDLKPIEDVNPQGTVVNMINTTAKVENASTSAIVDEKGKFESAKKSLVPGKYKVEASRIGYETQTFTVEMKGSTREKLEFTLKKIQEGQRRSIESAATDADKIINPGEVNIRPPGM